LQWLQKSSQIIGDNVNIVRHETSRTPGNRKKEYLKELMILKQTVRTKIWDVGRGINKFKKKSYQPRTNLVKDENSDLLEVFHISNKWKDYFSQLLNVHGFNSVWQIEIHTAEPLLPKSGYCEVELAIEKFGR